MDPENLHLAATTNSVRTAPSLPFDGVIPCQSGATIHGLDSRGVEPALAGPERGPLVRRTLFKTNYNTPKRVSPSHEALKISKNLRASSNHASAEAFGPRGERIDAKQQSVCPALSIHGGLSQIAARFCHSGWKLDALVRKEATLYPIEGRIR